MLQTIYITQKRILAQTFVIITNYTSLTIGYKQGWNYRLIIDGAILYFSFIEYRFVSTFNYRFPTLAIRNALNHFAQHLLNLTY